MNIRETLLDLIEKELAINKDTITDETNVEDLGVDKSSIDFVDLLFCIENTFEINIGNDEFLKVNNVKDIIQLIDKCIKKKSEEERKENKN